MIAGEGIVGIVLALLTVLGADALWDMSAISDSFPLLYDLSGVAIIFVTVYTLMKFSFLKKGR